MGKIINKVNERILRCCDCDINDLWVALRLELLDDLLLGVFGILRLLVLDHAQEGPVKTQNYYDI